MANPADGATVVLDSLSNALYTIYLKEYNESPTRFAGRKLNQMFKPKALPASGAGVELKFENYMLDVVRGSNDPLADPGSPDRFDVQKITARYNTGSPSTNDFLSLKARIRVSQLEVDQLTDAPNASIVQAAKKLAKQVLVDHDTKLALYRCTPKSGLIANVNGNLINGDGTTVYTGTSYTPSATDVRFKVDGGSFAAFRRGMKLVIYKSGGTDPVTCRVVGTLDPQNRSIRVQVESDSATANFGATTGLYDNGLIYLSGTTNSANEGLHSIESWSGTPSSGETTFIGGVDRTDYNYGFLNFTRVSAGSTAQKISKTHIETMFNSLQYMQEDNAAGVLVGATDIMDTLRGSIGEDAFTIADPSGEDKYGFGSSGLGYQHPHIGRVNFMADPLINPNKVLWLVPSTWYTCTYDKVAGMGLRPLSGDGGGSWYRMESNTPGAGRSLFHQMDFWNAGLLDICTTPELNAVLTEVKA